LPQPTRAHHATLANARTTAGRFAELGKPDKNEKSLLSYIHNQSLKPYYRGGKLTGVISGNRKYRFKTLGVRDEIERISERDKKRNLEREINR